MKTFGATIVIVGFVLAGCAPRERDVGVDPTAPERELLHNTVAIWLNVAPQDIATTSGAVQCLKDRLLRAGRARKEILDEMGVLLATLPRDLVGTFDEPRNWLTVHLKDRKNLSLQWQFVFEQSGVLSDIKCIEVIGF